MFERPVGGMSVETRFSGWPEERWWFETPGFTGVAALDVMNARDTPVEVRIVAPLLSKAAAGAFAS
jgi:hypothetical protein